MSNTIFHYCSLEAFGSIIKERNIRLSNAFKTNDAFELKWIFQLMKEGLIVDPQLVVKLEYLYEIGLQKFFRPHMICFSEEGDLLSQWRAYANAGKGISIGFNKEYFLKTQKVNANKEFKYFNIIYSKKAQEKAINKLIKNLPSKEDIDKLIAANLQDGKTFFMIAKIAEELFKIGITFKNPTFCEEKESRIVHGYPGLAAETDMFNYRFTDNNVISYIEIPIDNNAYDPAINEIIIGPKSKFTINDLQHFMQMNFPYQTGIKYYNSNCSLI